MATGKVTELQRRTATWTKEGAMSARASRLRLEEELKKILEQEERLNRDVDQLLQVTFLCVQSLWKTEGLFSSSCY